VEAEPFNVGAQTWRGLSLGQRVKQPLGRDRRHHRIGHGTGQVRLRLVDGTGLLRLERAACQGPEAGGDLAGDLFDLLIRGRGQGSEGEPLALASNEQPVGKEAVKVGTTD
jgi:hypothetical protein